MLEIKRILDNQKEVKYLTYYVSEEKDLSVKASFATLSINKQFKFKDKKACLKKLVDILFELKKLEAWLLNKQKDK